MCCAVTLHRQLRVDAVTAMRLVLRSASDHSRIPRVASSRFARLLFAAPSLLSLPLRFAPHQRFALPCLTNPEVRAVRNGALETGPEPRVRDLNPGFGT